MRQEFWKQLFEAMKDNPDIWCLVGDLGFGGADKIRDDFPDRFLNCGASEQGMLDIAVGLALSGKIPFVYTITPFFYRGFETLRTYINHEMINVKLCGSGRDADYEHDGFSHNASDVKTVLASLPNIMTFFPDDKSEIPTILDLMIKTPLPVFLSLKRGG